MRVSFHTLGCRLNQAETALAADDLSRHGFQVVTWGEEADILIINSCAVTGVASQKTRQAYRAARRKFPNAFIVLMGCDAKVDDWSSDGPDLVVPHPAPAPLSALLPSYPLHSNGLRLIDAGIPSDDFAIDGAARFADRTRANLKIQDGCSFFCSYCIVPYARGPARSRERSDVLREAKELIAAGYKELVLCGVNLTTYDSHGCDLADLIGEIAALDGDFRIRIGSAEPAPVISKIVELMRHGTRVCRFLHLPLQYGEDTILNRMRRHYSASEYAEIASGACLRIPGLCLGADVITGFPGETDCTFETCREFIESLPFGLLHVFPFSPRPGTDAASYKGKVPPKLSNARASILAEIGARKAEAFAQSQVGKTLQVLVEEENPPSGWSDNYLHVTLSSSYSRNYIASAKIASATGGRELRDR